MIKDKRLKPFNIPFLFFLALSLLSCTPPQHNVCVKNGKTYCVIPDWTNMTDWDSCYRRGLSCMEGECWEYGIDEFKQAAYLRYKDKRNVRTYGMHFLDEYFPHREMGICYFNLNRFEDAERELQISMEQTPSARAKYFLNQTRRASLLASGRDVASPSVHVISHGKELLTNQTPFHIKGKAEDDQYVAAVSINDSPLFIELAQPQLSFSFPVELHDGLNTIEVRAMDLVDKEDTEFIQVNLDQEGPLVIARPQEHPPSASGEITLTILVYDQSGVSSFRLDHREVPCLGLDTLCLVEQVIRLAPGQKSVPFAAEDLAGNSTIGEISPTPHRRLPPLAMRLACSDADGSFPLLTRLDQVTEDTLFSLDFKDLPPQTFYPDIFLEGEIWAQNGISQIIVTLDAWRSDLDRIKIYEREASYIHKIREIKEKNRHELVKNLQRQHYDPVKCLEVMEEIIKNNRSNYINQKIHLDESYNRYTLTILVEDLQGKTSIPRRYDFRKIHREAVYKSEQRMTLAIVPFDLATGTAYSRDKQDYILETLGKYFIQYGRFNLVAQEKLPTYLIEESCKSGRICEDDSARKIAEKAKAEGIICGTIKKHRDGIEIRAVFKEEEKGSTCLPQHDVFTPHDTTKELKVIIDGLAMKFCNSFPICEGRILEREGEIIQVDIGSDTCTIFPGMKYNIFREEQREDLLDTASIKKVERQKSEARMSEEEKKGNIRSEYMVRTR